MDFYFSVKISFALKNWLFYTFKLNPQSLKLVQPLNKKIKDTLPGIIP